MSYKRYKYTGFNEDKIMQLNKKDVTLKDAVVLAKKLRKGNSLKKILMAEIRKTKAGNQKLFYESKV